MIVKYSFPSGKFFYILCLLYAGFYPIDLSPVSVDIPHKNVTYIKKVIIYDEREGPVRTWMRKCRILLI